VEAPLAAARAVRFEWPIDLDVLEQLQLAQRRGADGGLGFAAEPDADHRRPEVLLAAIQDSSGRTPRIAPHRLLADPLADVAAVLVLRRQREHVLGELVGEARVARLDRVGCRDPSMRISSSSGSRCVSSS
jgi:hypothetical protein